MLQQITHNAYPGLLGVSLSGAGPSIWPLAMSSIKAIAKAIIALLSEAQLIHYDWQVLELAPERATVDYV